jgi:hypothetical protein
MRTEILSLLLSAVLVAFIIGCDGDGDGGDNVIVVPGDDGQEPAIDVTGTWSGDIQLPSGPSGVTLEMTQSGNTVTAAGGYTGSLNGNRLILTRDAITFDLTVNGDVMTGTYSDSSWNDRPVTLNR